jgi:WD40 repeat protein
LSSSIPMKLLADSRAGHYLSGYEAYGEWSMYSPHKHLLGSSGHDRSVRLWDIHTGQCIKIFQGHNNEIRSVAFTPSGQTLVTGNDFGLVQLWDLASGQSTATLRGHTNWVWSVAVRNGN